MAPNMLLDSRRGVVLLCVLPWAPNRTVMETVTLSSKGQLVIPKAVRDHARLSAGAVFSVRYEDGEIHLRLVSPAKASTLAEVAGCLANPVRKRLSKAQVDAVIRERLKARNAP